MKKFTLLFVATLFSALSFAAVPRVMAYDLKSEIDTPAKGFTKFTFSTNTKPTKAYLIFYSPSLPIAFTSLPVSLTLTFSDLKSYRHSVP